MPPRQAVSVALGRASALLSGAVLDVKNVSMSVPRWSDFVLLKRVSSSSSGGDAWEVASELQSSNVSWLKTAEVVLAPRIAKSQTVTVSTNVTLVDSVSSRAVVVEVWYVVRSIPDPRSLVSSAVMSQRLVVESREDEPALLSLSVLNVLSESLDSAAVWSEYWSADVEVHGRDLGASVSGLALDGDSSEVEERAGGSVVGVSNVSAATLAWNASSDDGSAAAGVLQVVPVASFAGVFRGSVVLVFRDKRSAAQKVEVARPLSISWRRRDLDLSVELRTMVFANESVSMPPRQAVSVALGRASALLSGAVLDVKSVSMSVPRWSDFVLLKRVSSSSSSGNAWEVAGELQSSNVSWLCGEVLNKNCSPRKTAGPIDRRRGRSAIERQAARIYGSEGVLRAISGGPMTPAREAGHVASRILDDRARTAA
ncbi:hypothetical protein PHYSODRAFT_333526 [Phytophthora sojae]|uniref:Uncharacterized protein n=1 Tax=Phytophthora sojae (strain P6497) TaxID=1094619 RepID=G4ZL37_PHYSP|nr:hypothetical protein PHYSODRAFT_333526 [Phytophthora sojae]EGZ15259.1 hypothetical protein PHYSODRAFT_333526 [Phytophthora sojae]|eukprot:XP_009529008.1 hypothetical protein PHYSODRAFT_333526 [Phytophthora sojae]